MNLYAGLEKFGIIPEKEQEDIYSRRKNEEKKIVIPPKPEEEKKEEAMIYDKKITCLMCDKEFSVKTIRSSSLRREESDMDLRPNFRGIDTLKYDVISCPHCGYTAMTRYFGHATRIQKKFLQEKICSQFQDQGKTKIEDYDYDAVITRYKLSLYNSVVKQGSASEIAYTCLKIAWLIRSYLKEIPRETEEERLFAENLEQEYEDFYEQAFDGFQQAISKEAYPICGMDTVTLDYLLAVMATHFHKYSLASKYLGSVLLSKTASRRVKDKALDLKQSIVESIRQEKKD